MEARQVRGLEIVTNSEITRRDNFWIVPSQSSSKSYAVTIDPPECNCPDFKKTAIKCKHIFAVQYYVERERGYLLPVVPKQRKTYRQVWPAYNLAQTNEKPKFLELLYELTRHVEDLPRKAGAGRNRLPLRDMIYCAAFKTYSLFSGRRFDSDVEEAQRRGYISRAPHFNSIFNYLELKEMTAWLQRLIATSSLPLNAVEWNFAVDATGISTGTYQKWVEAKWANVRTLFGAKVPNEVNRKDWVKLHLICGVQTNIVTGVRVTDAHAGDSPHFGPLVETTSENFPIQSVAADKAYSAEKNLKLVLVKGGMPYIDFRCNATTENPQSGDVWKRMLRFYQYNQESFMEHYHRRSNVEATFSMIKRKFGDRVRGKTETARINEVLCKVLCHNICCLVQSIYELGIEVDFREER